MAKRNGTKTTANVVSDMSTLINVARGVTVATFDAALIRATAGHDVIHAGRHVARFTGHRVMKTQNDTLASNATWELDDVQLLFVWRTLFPMSSGRLFTGSIADGIAIVRGVRADYNRTGHGMPTGKPTTESVSYGAKRFDTVAVPANPVIVTPTRGRKPRIAKPAA